MKKNVLLLAMLAAFGTAAMAQTNVTIYGVVDAGIAHVDNGTPDGTSWQQVSGGQYGSRVGFTGTEDLGGGLSASFKLENGFSVDDGTLGQGGRLFGRQAWAGLNGNFGSVKLGRQNNVIFDTLGAIDPFGTGFAAPATNLFSPYGFRMDNTISYTTPKMGAFSGELMYGFGEVAGNTTANRQFGASGTYANGPARMTVAYHDQEDPTGDDSAKMALIGGTYDFSVARLHLAYATDKGTGVYDTRDMLIGVSVPIGQLTLIADYVRKDDRVADGDADQIGLGVTYALSKRTNFYSSFARVTNDSTAQYVAGAPGATAKVFNFGVRHTF